MRDEDFDPATQAYTAYCLNKRLEDLGFWEGGRSRLPSHRTYLALVEAIDVRLTELAEQHRNAIRRKKRRITSLKRKLEKRDRQLANLRHRANSERR